MKWKSILSNIYILLLIILLAGINYNVSAFEYNQFNDYNSEFKIIEDYNHDFSNNNYFIENNNFHLKNRFNRFASITQEGSNNKGTICQIGNFESVVKLMQIGDNNKANINQIANFAKTEVFQFGSNLDVTVDHWITGTDIYVIQSGIDKYTEETKIIKSKSF